MKITISKSVRVKFKSRNSLEICVHDERTDLWQIFILKLDENEVVPEEEETADSNSSDEDEAVVLTTELVDGQSAGAVEEGVSND